MSVALRHKTPLMLAIGLSMFWAAPKAQIEADTSVVSRLAGFAVPADLAAMDTPNDAGASITVIWSKAPTAPAKTNYEVLVATEPHGPWFLGGKLAVTGHVLSDEPAAFGWNADSLRHFLNVSEYDVNSDSSVAIEDDRTYHFGLRVVADTDTVVFTALSASAEAEANWFNWAKLNSLILGLAFTAITLIMIGAARKDPNLYIRRVAGLDALDDALGRATEMGKATFFVHGLDGMSSISTIASMNILSQVSKRVAQFGTTLKVMNRDPIVHAVSRETVHEGCIEAGRPDVYKEDDVIFVAPDQFAYAAGVDGMIVHEKPAAVLLMGYFYAESLVFAETGAHAGAIQIAGTDSFTQLPFFITICDYTIMGEELYAASAYLSREPKLMGSIKGQDLGKVILLAVLVSGTVLATFGFDMLTRVFTNL